jgi:putative sigma-54 modulation protein
MNITYTGKSRDFTSAEQHKLDSKFARIAKLVDRKGERKAQVVVTSTRHLHKAEIRMQFEERPLVGIASDPDFYQAVSTAVDKLEKQTLKVREKTRDHRGPFIKIATRLDKDATPAPGSAKKPAVKGKAKPAVNGSNGIAAVVAEASGRSSRSAKIYRVADHKRGKPMTLDEAVLEIERNEDYFAFTDAKSGKLSVLVRRADGHFDLVEG